jgi:outer membrane protein OmpA-like peptidoglycan-associated protein
MKMIKRVFVLPAFAGLLLAGTGCKNMNKAQKGVVIGAGAGGAVGAVVGKAAGNTALGAIIGAAAGGVAGGLIGRKMDKQAEEIAQIPGAEVKRVGEGINVTFESGVLFAYDKDDVSPDARKKLSDLAAILNKYPDTYVLVEGHTDATGTNDYNMDLSRRRATSVATYLKSENIKSSRVLTKWYGEEQPKFSNDSESERSKNRRVEFAIYANEKMINDAKKEAGS